MALVKRIINISGEKNGLLEWWPEMSKPNNPESVENYSKGYYSMQNQPAVICYLALGSNLCNPQYQLAEAVNALKKLDKTRVINGSRVYRSSPLGPSSQPDYYNAVIALETSLEPEVLLDLLQSIENSQGRVRKERWGARTLDMDILLYGEQVINSPRLTIPHSQMHLRNFVIIPLCDIAPDRCLLTGESIYQLSCQLGMTGLFPTGKNVLDLYSKTTDEY